MRSSGAPLANALPFPPTGGASSHGSIPRLDLMRKAISMQSEASIGGASSRAIDSGWTFQLQPRPLQQHLADVEVAGGSGEMQRRLPRVRPSMHVNERT
jgi:hypothetical protein